MTQEALSLLEAARQGDRSAAEQMLKENNGLIWSVVRRYIGRGTESEDLYQLGCIGFLKAVISCIKFALNGVKFAVFSRCDTLLLRDVNAAGNDAVFTGRAANAYTAVSQVKVLSQFNG